MRLCEVEGCDRRHNAQGYCRVHYTAMRKSGVIRKLSAVDRFWAKVEKTDGCWLWTGTCSPSGYGQFGVNGKLSAAHRWLWAEVKGAIPDGLFLCHTCDVRNCVRPDHLFLGTAADNARDMVQKGRSRRWNRTECSQGHELTPENTYTRTTRLGYQSRDCRICRRERQQNRRKVAAA